MSLIRCSELSNNSKLLQLDKLLKYKLLLQVLNYNPALHYVPLNKHQQRKNDFDEQKQIINRKNEQIFPKELYDKLKNLLSKFGKKELNIFEKISKMFDEFDSKTITEFYKIIDEIIKSIERRESIDIAKETLTYIEKILQNPKMIDYKIEQTSYLAIPISDELHGATIFNSEKVKENFPKLGKVVKYKTGKEVEVDALFVLEILKEIVIEEKIKKMLNNELKKFIGKF